MCVCVCVDGMNLKYALCWHIHIYQFILYTRILKPFEDSKLTGLKVDIAKKLATIVKGVALRGRGRRTSDNAHFLVGDLQRAHSVDATGAGGQAGEYVGQHVGVAVVRGVGGALKLKTQASHTVAAVSILRFFT